MKKQYYKTFRQTLILNSEDIKSIISQVGLNEFMDKSISKIESYFKNQREKIYERKPRIGFRFDGRTVESMFCRRKGSKICFKIVNFHETNPQSKLPTIMSSTILCDEETGFQEVIADSTLLTYIRTGASAAIATKYLARSDSSRVGIIGAGCIGQTCAHALSRIYNLKKIYVWDIDKSALGIFQKRMKHIIKVPIEVQPPQKFIPKVDVIITATYGGEIVVKNSWICSGVHINAIGGDMPHKRELDSATLKRSKIVVDYKEQAINEGEIQVPISKGIISPKNIYAELFEIVSKRKIGRKDKSEITLFDSTGDPTEDLAILDLVLEYNKKLNLGKLENFICVHKHPKDPYGVLIGENNKR